MKRLMPTGLPGLVVDEVDLRRLQEHRLAVAHLELRHADAADDLLGRDAVDLLGEDAHEFDAAARDDEGLEAVGAQVGEQLEHRLVDAGRCTAAGSAGAAPCAIQSWTICANSSVVMPACVAAMTSNEPFFAGRPRRPSCRRPGRP